MKNYQQVKNSGSRGFALVTVGFRNLRMHPWSALHTWTYGRCAKRVLRTQSGGAGAHEVAPAPSGDTKWREGGAARRSSMPSCTTYPFFPDLIENQIRSLQTFWEKGLHEEFELFSHIIGKKKNLQMILHGSEFLVQKPRYTLQESIQHQKTYSVSLYLPIQLLKRNENIRQATIRDDREVHEAASGSATADGVSQASHSPARRSGLGVPPIAEHGARAATWTLGSSTTHGHALGVVPVFLGEIPLMTERGSFLINGSSRVLVNQIVRCPSVYFKVKIDHKNRRTYIASFLSDYGSWLRLETDYKNRVWVRIDKSQRIPIYMFLRALGFPENFLQYQLKNYRFLLASKEIYYTENPHVAIQALWKKFIPGRWNSLQGCYAFLYNKFFHPRKYSIGPVGRVQLNKRLARKSGLDHDQRLDPRVIQGEAAREVHVAADGSSSHFVSGGNRPEVQVPRSGLPISSSAACLVSTLTPEDVFLALDLLIQFHDGKGKVDDIDHLKNRRVRLPGELIQNQFRLALNRVTQVAIEKISKFELENECGFAISPLIESAGPVHAATREGARLAPAAHDQRSKSGVAAGALQVARAPLSGSVEPSAPSSALPSAEREGGAARRFSHFVSDGPGNKFVPANLPVKEFFQSHLFGSSLRELFNTSQLSQYMDQTNPLSEITHKRRLSSLGPGGIGRDQAGFAVREIHPSHFGRICPIETPEGPNAGLVGSLASYCRITEEGFLQSPYRFNSDRESARHGTWAKPLAGQDFPRATMTTTKGWTLGSSMTVRSTKPPAGPGAAVVGGAGVVEKQDWFLLPSEGEDEVYICSENDPNEIPVASARGSALDDLRLKADQRSSVHDIFPARYKQEFFRVPKTKIDFFSISPIQMISLATSLIPFLEHDDANRALMGSNMQRQAVPLLWSEKPFVGTGLERQAARDSSTVLLAKRSGQVNYVDSSFIVIKSGALAMAEPSYGRPALAARPSGTMTKGPARAEPPAGHGPASINDLDSYELQKYWRSNQNTCLHQRPNVQQSEWIEKGELIADGTATNDGEISLGKNILLAYMPWEGYNFEDAIVISERLVQEDVYTSLHIDRYDVEVRDTPFGKEKITNNLTSWSPVPPSAERRAGEDMMGRSRDERAKPLAETGTTESRLSATRGPTCGSARYLNSEGIIYPGTWVEEGDILVGKITPISPPKATPEYRLLLAIFETKALPFKDSSLRVPPGVEGRVLQCIDSDAPERTEWPIRTLLTSPPPLGAESLVDLRAASAQATTRDDHDQRSRAGVAAGGSALAPSAGGQSGLRAEQLRKIQVFLVHKRKIQLGDKMSGRHGNKGIVSLILPPQDMPFLQDGKSVDIVLNPLGVPSRMNVGQVLECLFGLAAFYLQEYYRLVPFDEMYGKNSSRGLVYKKLYEASLKTGQKWIFDPNSPGKTHIFDGRTGESFHQAVLVGYSYMFKLIHLVDEKMHARSTGPYSLVTQQPLGGRSKHGGQRLGEMEVWALEGFGASFILQEFLTIKSDEIYARNTFLFHLMKRRKLPCGGLPESFRVLVHELQSLCLSLYYNPDFRLTYPSLIGWDGLFLLSSRGAPRT